MKADSKILVVDDDPNLRRTLADILRVKGYATVTAANGGEAIAVAERELVSLALIDLKLPDMPGLEVMARIKAISPLTEAIILTGHASMDSAIEATRQGAFSYLLKPYQMDDLLLTIRHGVERHEAQEEILRLASFPRLHPDPVIELNQDAKVTYLNPAAERLFPDLRTLGVSHPLLRGSAELLAGLRQSKGEGTTTREIALGEAVYEMLVCYVGEIGLMRIYVMDITRRKRAEEEIHVLATTDSLTGIANRREFSSILARELAAADRYGTPIALAMYDLDNFKRVNDRFGHDVGDHVLRAVTELVQRHIRAADVAGRWGGEEFMLLMPRSDLHSACVVAEKLRQLVAGHRFEKAGSVTVSFGVAELEQDDDINSLLKRVDDALYRAKELGRNRVKSLSVEDVAS